MPSNTFAAVVSACSRMLRSTYMTLLMLSGSVPSTTSCKAFCTKSSCSRSIIISSPSRPCLRAMLLHSTILAMRRRPSRTGGRMTQGKILSARCMTGSGVWMKMAANVPTTTIMNAADDTSAISPAPFSTAPTRMAFSASTSPMMLNMSNRAPLHPETRQQRIHVCLARSVFAFGHARHGGSLSLALALSHRRVLNHVARQAPGAGQRGFQLLHQLHHAADDLAGQILVALRHQHIGQVPADQLRVGTRSRQESLHRLDQRLQTFHRLQHRVVTGRGGSAVLQIFKSFNQGGRFLSGALGQRTGLLDE